MARRSGHVKREPGVATANSLPPSDDTEAATSNIYDNSQTLNQSFVNRGERSDAPPPSTRLSEKPSESEAPLLREMRHRPDFPINMGSPTEESFLQNSFQDIGKKLKACNDTLGELQQLGVSHAVSLPELVLVGDQSSGKSTLLSGLAKLDLPRSEGTCTRCPLHIRVSRNDQCSSRVFLRKEYVYCPPQDGTPIEDCHVTDQDPFYPWKKLPGSQSVEFKSMTDQSQIENVLRWAQVAILNDGDGFEQYVPGSGAIAKETPVGDAAAATTAKFSPNVVHLEIKGPDLPDLSIYDMPGIFQNPADIRDQYLTNVVRNLSSEYINHDSAIIICAMAMNVDAENSFTMNLVRRLQASHRTLGVLTKADLLPASAGGYDQWLNIMRGHHHQTGLGYFITARKEDTPLEDLPRWEQHFFNPQTSENWPREFQPFGDRCGVEKVNQFLSERLAQQFARSLPNIKRTVLSRLTATEKELRGLPEMPTNIEAELRESLREFDDSARRKIEEFTKGFSALPANFRDCLTAMKPRFVLRDRSDAPVIELSDDDSDTSMAATPTPKRRMNGLAQSLPKRPRFDGSATSFGSTTPVKQEEDRAPASPAPPRAPTGPAQLPEPFTKFSNVGSGFATIGQVYEEKLHKTRSGMPHRIQDEMYELLVKRALQPFKGPAEVFLDRTRHDLAKVLEDAASKTFATLKKRLVYRKVKAQIKEYLEHEAKAIMASIDQLYRNETTQILTFNLDAFNRYNEDELAVLTHFRHHQRMIAHGTVSSKFVPWDVLNEDKRAQALKQRQNDETKIREDKFIDEIKIIAYVRAYYRLAALRFADTVSQCIICQYLPTLRKGLGDYIKMKLQIDTGDEKIFESLMDEDVKTATTRARLKGEKEKFVRALQSIERLESGVSVGDEERLTEATLLDEGDVTMDDDGVDGAEA